VCQPRSWLIFDVRQRMKRIATVLSLLVLAGCNRGSHVSSARLLLEDSALVVVGVAEDTATAKYRLSEVLKSDGTVSLRYKTGDSLRLGSPAPSGKRVGDMRLVFVGRVDRGDDLMPFRDYTTMEVFEGSIPGLDCGTLDELRKLAARK